MKRLLKYLLLLLVLIPLLSISQNLIPNPGFEGHGDCKGLNTEVKDWKLAKGNYYHYLCDCPVPKAMYSGEDKNKPHTGIGLAGVCVYGKEAGEYMIAPLTQPLTAGKVYYFSGYILLADEKKYGSNYFKSLEVGFPSKEYQVAEPSFIFFDPQIRIPVSFAGKEKEWQFISGRFTAAGNETHIIIGNFLPAELVTTDLTEYMTMSENERESFLKKNAKLAGAMTEFTNRIITSQPYSIRCYFDDLCLMPMTDSSSGYCNYPVWKAPPPPEVKPEVNKPIVLENIFFETAKSTLLPASYPSLDKLVESLKKSPNAEILISGHTDNKGNEEENKKLSMDRAAAVKAYLASQGAVNKIETNGFGSTKPIASNDTEEGRSKNRRVEFTITRQ